MSMVKLTDPGTTLLAPGHTLRLPTVQTRPSAGLWSGGCLCCAPRACTPPQRPLTQRTTSAAATRGSLRMGMGTVPAWPLQTGA